MIILYFIPIFLLVILLIANSCWKEDSSIVNNLMVLGGIVLCYVFIGMSIALAMQGLFLISTNA